MLGTHSRNSQSFNFIQETITLSRDDPHIIPGRPPAPPPFLERSLNNVEPYRRTHKLTTADAGARGRGLSGRNHVCRIGEYTSIAWAIPSGSGDCPVFSDMDTSRQSLSIVA